MAQNHSKSDTLAHATPSLDQRNASETHSTKEQKNSFSAEVQEQMRRDQYPDAPTSVQEANSNTTSNAEQSRGKTVDDQLDAEDAAEVAKKDQAKAQSAAAHGKDVN